MCRNCFMDYLSVSGGAIGGEDPPAYQRSLMLAQREEEERIERELAEQALLLEDGTAAEAEAEDANPFLLALESQGMQARRRSICVRSVRFAPCAWFSVVSEIPRRKLVSQS